MATLDMNSQVENYKLKTHRLIIPFTIVHNATPASKVESSDLPDALVLSLEGQTAAATAIDSGTNFTTQVDSTGNFSCLVRNLGTVSKLLDVQVVNISSGTATVARKGASSTGVTASGNIAVSLDSSLDLSAVDLTASLVVEYTVSHN